MTYFLLGPFSFDILLFLAYLQSLLQLLSNSFGSCEVCDMSKGGCAGGLTNDHISRYFNLCVLFNDVVS